MAAPLIFACLTTFTPLPPDVALPDVPPLPNIPLQRGAVLQLWGHSQYVALTDHRVPLALQAAYAFDLVIVVPRAAHNSMCQAETHGQQCTKADQLTDEQFQSGVENWANLNLSIILYTSIMHCGHSPMWENGTLSRAHPEYSERDEGGACPAHYGQCNLSPVGESVEASINYTRSIIKEYRHVRAVMIDNAFWENVSPTLPSGFSIAAKRDFRQYVVARFGDAAKAFLGVNASDVEPPSEVERNETAPSPLFGIWKLWRARAYAAAVERYRKALRPSSVSVLANTVFWPPKATWQLGGNEVLQRVDGVVAESHDSSAAEMALKEEVARAFAVSSHIMNYIALFDQSCQSHYQGQKCALRNVTVVRGMLVASFMHGSKPWLVAWGLSKLIDAPSSVAQAAREKEASTLMQFRAHHVNSLYPPGGSANQPQASKAARVGVLVGWRSGEYDSQQALKGAAASLRALGVPYRIETGPTMARGALEVDAPCPLDLLLCEGMSAMDAPTADGIAAWVRRGGTLVARRGSCGVMDEASRPYPKPLLEAALEQGGTGRGKVLVVDGGITGNASAVALILSSSTRVISPRTPGHPKSTSWETVPWWFGGEAATSRGAGGWLAIHFSNATEAGGASNFGTLKLQVALPPAFPDATQLSATLFSAYEATPRSIPASLSSGGGNRLATLTVQSPPWYGVVRLGTASPQSPWQL
jgi:hypothetical protein